MAMSIVPGFVKDERTFSKVGFVKGKLQNKLSNYLSLYYSHVHIEVL